MNAKKGQGRYKAWREYNYRKNPNYYKNPFKPIPRKPNRKSILFQKSCTNWRLQKEKEIAEKNIWMQSFYNPIPITFLSPSAFQPNFDNLSSETHSRDKLASHSQASSKKFYLPNRSNSSFQSSAQSTYRSGKYSFIKGPCEQGEFPFRQRLVNVLIKIRRLGINTRDFTKMTIFSD